MSAQNNKIHSRPAVPRLYIWPREILFLGTRRSRHRPHRVVQEKLILCLEGSLSVRQPDGSRIHTGSCLLPTGMMIDDDQVNISNAVIGLCFLAPFSQDYPALGSLMKPVAPGIFIDHPNEKPLIRELLCIRDTDEEMTTGAVYRRLRDLIIPPEVAGLTFRQFDDRVVEIARIIRSRINENVSVAELADAVNLSDSRLEKLFKEQTGLPITRYRLRYRVFISALMLGLGRSVTDAALGAGFSSSAHFSRSYSAATGLAPSTTFLKAPYLKTSIDPEVIRSLAPVLENGAEPG